MFLNTSHRLNYRRRCDVFSFNYFSRAIWDFVVVSSRNGVVASIVTQSHVCLRNMADGEQRVKDSSTVGAKDTMIKQEKRESNALMNGGKGSGDDADSLEELPLDIGEHYLVRRSDDWREYRRTSILFTPLPSLLRI